MVNKKMKYVISFILLIALVALLFGATINVAADSSSSEEKNPQTIMAEQYSKHYGVSIDEAFHRLKLQDSFPGLSTALEENEKITFGGLWIQHEPTYKIIVAFTRDADKTLGKYRQYIPEDVAPYFEVRTVSKSVDSLTKELENLLASFKSQGLKVDARVDIINNCVSIDVAKSDTEIYNTAIQNGRLVIPENLRVKFVDSLAILATNIYGGLYLSCSDQTYGTSGFAVKSIYSGIKGIATAAHLDNQVYYNSIGLVFKSEKFGYSYDCQWHTCPGFTVTNKICYWPDGSTWSITSVKPRSQQNVGDYVCKYGVTTGFTIGMITSKTAAPTGPYAVPNASPTWMEVYNIFGYPKIADGGDSGGPWFNSNCAWGITSMVSGDRQVAYYMAEDYLAYIGVSVMTSP